MVMCVCVCVKRDKYGAKYPSLREIHYLNSTNEVVMGVKIHSLDLLQLCECV